MSRGLTLFLTGQRRQNKPQKVTMPSRDGLGFRTLHILGDEVVVLSWDVSRAVSIAKANEFATELVIYREFCSGHDMHRSFAQ